MKSFQGLITSDVTGTLDDNLNQLIEIRKAIHELLWKYLRGHLKRDQIIQVSSLELLKSNRCSYIFCP